MTEPVARVGELAEQIRGVTYAKADASSTPKPGYLPVLRAGNITDDGLDFDDLVFVPAGRISAKQRIRKFDVLVAASSGSLSIVGKAAPALGDYEGGFGAFCKVLRPGPKVDPRYFAHFFKTQDYRRRISALAAGIGINNLRGEHLDDMQIPLPTLPEQRRIAEMLDRAEALRAKRRAALAHLDTLTQSIFLDMFGDPATNPKGWPRKSISDAVMGKYGIKAGPFGSSLLKSDYTASGYRVYGQEQVLSGRFDIGDYYIGERKYEQLKSCAVQKGDLLVSLVGSFGKVLVVPPGIEPGIINPRLLKITPNHRLLTSRFLATFLGLATIQAELERMSHGGTMGILNAGLLRGVSVVLPPLSLQREFADRVDAVEELKASHQASLAQLGALFTSLQHRAFRGQLLT